MYRSGIRFLGCLVAVFTSVFHRTGLAETKTGFAYYTTKPVYQKVSGFAYYGTGQNLLQNYNCSLEGTNIAPIVTGCNFDTTVCFDRTVGGDGSLPTGTGSGGGGGGQTFISGEDSIRCALVRCLSSSYQTGLDYCSGTGYGFCNTSGLYCVNSGIFAHYGVIPNTQGAVWDRFLRNEFVFDHCETGWYITNANNYCSGTATPSLSNISACCAACPGFRNYPTGETFTNTSNTNTYNGYFWYAGGSGVGITSCIAFTSGNGIYTDAKGKYDISSGCPYKN